MFSSDKTAVAEHRSSYQPSELGPARPDNLPSNPPITGQSASSARRSRFGAFTLVQVVVVLGVVILLAGATFGFAQRGRSAAMRSGCDVHLKAISMALDAYRQETGGYPTSLSQLQTAKFLSDPAMLRCGCDPRLEGTYDDFYLYRGARAVKGDTRDPDTLPFVVCPFHEEDNGSGNQAFAHDTEQNKVFVATLRSASSATVERPGKSPVAARSGMQVRGGDRLRTSGGGTVVVEFADGSTASLLSNADLTVLQSFMESHGRAPLYTLVRQHLGEIVYKVHTGSRFDVATPTATAGALGTEFRIKQRGEKWYLKVIESKVMCVSTVGSAVYASTGNASNSNSGWSFIGREHSGDNNNGGGNGDDEDNGGNGNGDDDDDDDNSGRG